MTVCFNIYHWVLLSTVFVCFLINLVQEAEYLHKLWKIAKKIECKMCLDFTIICFDIIIKHHSIKKDDETIVNHYSPILLWSERVCMIDAQISAYNRTCWRINLCFLLRDQFGCGRRVTDETFFRRLLAQIRVHNHNCRTSLYPRRQRAMKISWGDNEEEKATTISANKKRLPDTLRYIVIYVKYFQTVSRSARRVLVMYGHGAHVVTLSMMKVW